MEVARILEALLVVLFALDAWLRSARGGPEERRRVIVVGGSFVLFVVMAAGTGALAQAGVIEVPYMLSMYFLAIVAVAGNELSFDVARAVQLSRQLESSESALRENKRRLEGAAAAAQTAIWEWNISADEIWITDQGRDLFGFAPGRRMTQSFLERFIRKIVKSFAGPGTHATVWR
jgi:hypothetical protein